MSDIPSNLKQVYAMINNQKVIATYDDAQDLYIIETSAPAESSWNQPDHVFGVTIYAEDMAGNTVECGPDDPTYGDQLKIRVLEKTKPNALITAPTQDSVLGSDKADITMELSDEGGSGLNLSTVLFKVNSIDHSSDLSWSDGISGEKIATYHATNLRDGVNTIELAVTDNDGNTSEEESISFVVSTSAPSLVIIAPIEGLVTNASPVTITGVAKPGTSYVTVTSATVNGQTVELDESGNFTYEQDLISGSNEIKIVATDTSGNSTEVIRHVILDVEAPIISDVVAEALTVDAGGLIKITFKVSEA